MGLPLLLLSIDLYRVVPTVSRHGGQGPYLSPFNSIVAGCARAASLVRTFFWHVFHVLRTTFPRVKDREYIDDLVTCLLAFLCRRPQ